jgi:hypothetical protein
MLLVFFEGIDSEREIAWRVADSLSLRQFIRYGMDEATPNHVTISRTRWLVTQEKHQWIFHWFLEQLARGGCTAPGRDRRGRLQLPRHGRILGIKILKNRAFGSSRSDYLAGANFDAILIRGCRFVSYGGAASDRHTDQNQECSANLAHIPLHISELVL